MANKPDEEVPALEQVDTTKVIGHCPHCGFVFKDPDRATEDFLMYHIRLRATVRRAVDSLDAIKKQVDEAFDEMAEALKAGD